MNLFGANWKTTVSGGLQSLISAFVTGTLTFPSNWQDPKQVVIFSLVVLSTFFGLQFAVATKSKNVTGGNIQQTADGSVAAPSAQLRSSSVEETREATRPKP